MVDFSDISMFPPAGSAWNEAITRVTEELERGEIEPRDIRQRLLEEINKSSLDIFYRSLIITPFIGIITGIFLYSFFGILSPNYMTYALGCIISFIALIIVVVYFWSLLRRLKSPEPRSS